MRPTSIETADPALEDETRAAAGDRVSGARSRQRAGWTRRHALRRWLLEHGATEADLAWFREHAVDLPGDRHESLSDVHAKAPPARAAGRLAHPHAVRIGGPRHPARAALSRALRRAAVHLRDGFARLGRPAPGLAGRLGRCRPRAARRKACRWSATRGGRCSRWSPGPIARAGGRRPHYLAQMGLWDLDPAPDAALERLPTPLVDAYRALAPPARILWAADRKRNRASPRPEDDLWNWRCFAASSLPASRARPATTATGNGSIRSPRPGMTAASTRITATSRRSASCARARRCAGRWSTSGAAAMIFQPSSLSPARRGRTASR